MDAKLSIYSNGNVMVYQSKHVYVKGYGYLWVRYSPSTFHSRLTYYVILG